MQRAKNQCRARISEMEKERERLFTQLEEKENITKQKEIIITQKQQEWMKGAEALSLSHEDLKLQFVKIRTTHELLIKELQSKKNNIEQQTRVMNTVTALHAQNSNLTKKTKTSQNFNRSTNPTYAQMTSRMSQTMSMLPKSATILKKRTSTKINMSTIKEILNRETKKSEFKPIKSRTLARDKNTLIIHAEKDENTCKIVDYINNIKKLQDVVEVGF